MKHDTLSDFSCLLYLNSQETPLAVSAFQGSVGLSEPFVLQGLARCPKTGVPACDTPMGAALVLRTAEDPDYVLHGVLTRAESSGAERFLFRLQSPLELLDTPSPELVFDGMDMPQAIAGLLAGAGFEPGRDFGFHLTEGYEPWPVLRSEQDTPFDFLYRMLARAGLCCLHESSEQGGLLLFSDAPLQLAAPVVLRQVEDLRCGRAVLPAEIEVRGSMRAGQGREFRGVCPVPSGSRGRLLFADERVRSDADALQLARIFAEQAVCAGWNIRGRTPQPLQPGMSLQDANGLLGRAGENYLVTEVAHQGRFDADPAYCCFFRALPASVRFRPQRLTPRRMVRDYQQAKKSFDVELAAYTEQLEIVRLQEKLLEISRKQASLAARMLEANAERLVWELDLFVGEVENGLAELEIREYFVQEADQLKSDLAWLQQRHCEEIISMNNALEDWGEDQQTIVL